MESNLERPCAGENYCHAVVEEIKEPETLFMPRNSEQVLLLLELASGGLE